MRWAIWLPLLLGVVSAASLGIGFLLGHRPSPPASAPLPADRAGLSPAQPLSPDDVRDLVELRQRQGSVLGGSLLDDRALGASGADAEGFARSLQQRASGRAETTDSPRETEDDDPVVHLAEQLQSASRLLREHVATLEEEGQFEEADRLRRLVRRLRREARFLIEDRFAPPAGEAPLDVEWRGRWRHHLPALG